MTNNDIGRAAAALLTLESERLHKDAPGFTTHELQVHLKCGERAARDLRDLLLSAGEIIPVRNLPRSSPHGRKLSLDGYVYVKKAESF